MRHMIYIVSTLIATVLFSVAVHAFERHCGSTDGKIRLDVSDSLSGVQEGELHGALLAEHPALKQASVAMRCLPQGSDSATLLRCTPTETGRWPLVAYIFRGSRPEWPPIFARVYLSGDILADLITCS